MRVISSMQVKLNPKIPRNASGTCDYISDMPDECFTYIFQSLGSDDRKSNSLVYRR
uniref:F-box domain-containing protein n=1 Tax=Nelumbo nucifera TaxID=4432 RepID=A0A822ZVH5_NELNU|nr:TPA_asm: hypothetical protein HUJ06_017272 [Nelumbo nucifera]